MKGNFYKKITRYYGYGRADLWWCGRKTRKIIKTNDARRYRRFRKKDMLKDLNSTDP
jgi:hypothetical protein